MAILLSEKCLQAEGCISPFPRFIEEYTANTRERFIESQFRDYQFITGLGAGMEAVVAGFTVMGACGRICSQPDRSGSREIRLQPEDVTFKAFCSDWCLLV